MATLKQIQVESRPDGLIRVVGNRFKHSLWAAEFSPLGHLIRQQDKNLEYGWYDLHHIFCEPGLGEMDVFSHWGRYSRATIDWEGSLGVGFRELPRLKFKYGSGVVHDLVRVGQGAYYLDSGRRLVYLADLSGNANYVEMGEFNGVNAVLFSVLQEAYAGTCEGVSGDDHRLDIFRLSEGTSELFRSIPLVGFPNGVNAQVHSIQVFSDGMGVVTVYPHQSPFFNARYLAAFDFRSGQQVGAPLSLDELPPGYLPTERMAQNIQIFEYLGERLMLCAGANGLGFFYIRDNGPKFADWLPYANTGSYKHYSLCLSRPFVESNGGIVGAVCEARHDNGNPLPLHLWRIN